MMVQFGSLTIVFLYPDWSLTILNASKKEDTGTEEPTTASLNGWFGGLWVTLIGWFRGLWAALIGWFGGLWGGLVIKSQIWWLEVCNVTAWRKNFCQHFSFNFPQNIGKVMKVRHYRKIGEGRSHEMWKSQRCNEYYSVAAENVMK